MGYRIVGLLCIALFGSTHLAVCDVTSVTAVQHSTQDMLFSIASIRENHTSNGRWRSMFTQDGYSATGVTVKQLLQDALGAYEDAQILGLPSWATRERFDLETKVDLSDVPNFSGLPIEKKRAMLLALLVDRFHLSFHDVSLMRTGYLLSETATGFHANDASGSTSATNAPENHAVWTRMRPGQWTCEHCSMSDLSRVLALTLGMPVLNTTHLAARYAFHLEWVTPGDDSIQSTANAQDGNVNGPSLLLALKEQLGLQLTSSKLPVTVRHVDRLEHPTGN